MGKQNFHHVRFRFHFTGELQTGHTVASLSTGLESFWSWVVIIWITKCQTTHCFLHQLVRNPLLSSILQVWKAPCSFWFYQYARRHCLTGVWNHTTKNWNQHPRNYNDNKSHHIEYCFLQRKSHKPGPPLKLTAQTTQMRTTETKWTGRVHISVDLCRPTSQHLGCRGSSESSRWSWIGLSTITTSIPSMSDAKT